MEDPAICVGKSLESLCSSNQICRGKLHGFLSKQIWSPADRSALLERLSELLLSPLCSGDIARSFPAIILDLLHRSQQIVTKTKCHVQHQLFCVAASKALHIVPHVKGFLVQYLSSHAQFYRPSSAPCDEEPVPKRAKKSGAGKKAPARKEIAEAVWTYLLHACEDLREAWDWSDWLEWVHVDDRMTKWYVVESLGLLMSMSPTCLHTLKTQHFSQQEIQDFTLLLEQKHDGNREKARLLANPKASTPGQTSTQSHTMHAFVDTDFSDCVTSVCGVLLSKNSLSEKTAQGMEVMQQQQGTSQQQQQQESADTGMSSSLVMVGSTRRNLRSLALAVASGRHVLLEGPVGCGKTALVEHLAALIGRQKPPEITKVQLGDQTDSKALLGTYRCTSVPGEFVWQAGCVTRAVTEGHWLLMEDLDYAPMDVVSVLVPLLEANTLSVPGHGDTIRAHPHFRLFATQRLLHSGSGLYKQQGSGAEILDKLWTNITVEPLSKSEIKKVIETRHPQLATVVDRLVEIYFLLSAGRHDLEEEVKGHSEDEDSVEEQQDVGKFLSHEGRMISTRDLMKWIGRIAADFEVNDPNVGSRVFQEALDCFCACLAKPERRLPLAEAIAARLNVTKTKAEYYMCKYKPSVEMTSTRLTVGRVSVPKVTDQVAAVKKASLSRGFAFTRQSVCLLERVAVSVARNEPVLLVGETGVGKTSSVQYLAEQLGHKLHVVNMNQQSDSTDLLGGFKPVEIRLVVAPFKEDFELLFCKSFSRKQNIKFLSHIQECYSKRNWVALFKLMEHTQKSAVKKYEKDSSLCSQWTMIGQRLHQLKAQVKQAESALAFTFIEGSLVSAVRQGHWVLLDEINLASAETLECLSGLLESSGGSLVLMERGDTAPIVRHPDFRLFACMNPATDVGKKDLPPGVRNRFTELFVDELQDPQDLKVLVAEYLRGLSLSSTQIDAIVRFYLDVRQEACVKLTDGTGQRPHFSLRTLCRALRQAASNQCGHVQRSLYEGLCLSFLTQLDRSSHPLVTQLVAKHVLGQKTSKALLKQPLPKPQTGAYLAFEGYWVEQGEQVPNVPESYVLTPAVRDNLRDLCRVVAAGRFPVLLQGETSVGKTSLITWLAQATGNVCRRINNHEHTDLQEYVGCYAADSTGKLVFREGVLVEAMRKGQWIILDELNLAPTDVLEALNRLLDDNRELFIPETQETVSAHPRFMLFATQNPPGQYGGRKMLSRAFRNRFIELHFDEIPSAELETILHERCQLPRSYSHRLVAILLDLQTQRRGSSLFAGKQGFITLRDLFRWAERYRQASHKADAQGWFDWDQQLADNGYMLLAGRVRKQDECVLIQQVIEKHLKRKVRPDLLFNLNDKTSPTTSPILREITQTLKDGSVTDTEGKKGKGKKKKKKQQMEEERGLQREKSGSFDHVVWTHNMRRMAVLVGQAVKFGEPVLLVGETGCGKTTICQLYAELREQQLYAVNCHLHTESADFLGGLRPVRHREASQDDGGCRRLFEWVDGPLVKAMRDNDDGGGGMVLIDEISLADDSVLERLNSVLEPERTLLLAEKGGGDEDVVETITAGENFRVLATMNPGGDYGKKELSPALRNRFTEIWCSVSNERDDLATIVEHNLHPDIHLCNREDGTSGFGHAIMDFLDWFTKTDTGKKVTVSIRDLLSWVRFINATARTLSDPADSTKLEPAVAYIHGACMVFLDALGTGSTSGFNDGSSSSMRTACLSYLCEQISSLLGSKLTPQELGLVMMKSADSLEEYLKMDDPNVFGIFPFFIEKGPLEASSLRHSYALTAPTTCLNAQRVLRGIQLPRPILLEGSPGVGKTSLVAAIAKAAGHELVRINLSEQTDISDLFGADLPVEGGEGGEFAWRDGPLLQALKAGHWVVLDELNLASQSVLEGLNACLDHRAEVYIPELGRSFAVQHGKTRLFACQNPLNQGGGRKGLPKSFLNRFTQVHVEPLSRSDLLHITTAMFPQLPPQILTTMVDFNTMVVNATMQRGSFGQRGAPWEFNLRDVFRWAELLIANQKSGKFDPGEYLYLIYADRMRTVDDKEKMFELFETCQKENLEDDEIMTCEPRAEFHKMTYRPRGELYMSNTVVQVGHSKLQRQEGGGIQRSERVGAMSLLHRNLAPLESLMKCIQMNWMAILLGSSGSGKTSMVELLAYLTGHPLSILPMNSAMDTTELLGGFEQADLKRHVEEVSNTVATILNHVTTVALTANQKPALNEMQKIMAKWEVIQKMTIGGPNLTGEDELNDLQSKISALKTLLSMLGDCNDEISANQQDSLTACSCRLEEIGRKVSSALSGSGGGQGGQFEWIDSVLVKALRDGHWMLIDNVNFCSASVLDRLNALLEPNGVLVINERGVIDGEIPTIKPHPDFRLILAMDPKYGEISRAMRNRGVEIFIPSQDEGSPYSEHDIKQLLHGLGLVGRLPCDALISLHDKLSSSASSSFRSLPITDLLGIATLTLQQLERGADLEDAMRNSANEVYARSEKQASIKQERQLIIATHFDDLDLDLCEGRGSCDLLEAALWPLGTPSVADWTRDTTAATFKRDAALIFHNFEKISAQIAGTKSPLPQGVVLHPTEDTLNSDDLDNDLAMLPTTLELLVEVSSLQSWELGKVWLLKMLKERFGADMKKAEVKGQGFEVSLLKVTPKVIEAGLNTVFHHPLAEELMTMMKNTTDTRNAVGDAVLCQPFDLRWSPALTHGLPASQDQTHDVWTKMQAICNQLYIVYRIEMLHHVHTLYSEGYGERKARIHTYSPLQLSRAVHEGSLDESRLAAPCLSTLYPLHTLMYHNLQSLFSAYQAVTDEDYDKCLSCLQWYDRFIHVCSSPLVSFPGDSLLPTLSLHWNWLYGKMITPLFAQHSVSSDLQSVLSSLHTVLGVDDRRSRLQSSLSRHLGHPLPFHDHRTADAVITVEDLIQKVSLVDPLRHATADKVINQIQLLLDKGQQWRMLGLNVLHDLYTKPYEDVEGKYLETSAAMKDLLVQYRVITTEDDNVALAVPAVNPIAVTTWPLVHWLHLVAEHNALAQTGSVQDGDIMERMVEYAIGNTPVSSVGLLPWKELNHAENKSDVLHRIHCSLFVEHMGNLSANFCNKHWLTWTATPQADDQEDQIQHSSQGPAMLHTARLSYCSSYLLTGNAGSESAEVAMETTWLPGNIACGQTEEMQGQLQQLTRTLWRQGGVHDKIRMSSCQLLLNSLCRLLSVLITMLPADKQTEANSILAAMETNQTTNTANVKNLISELTSLELSPLCTDFSHILVEGVTQVLRYKEIVSRSSEGYDLDEMLTLGQGWCIVGMLYSQLLAPQGPVDPAHRQTVKLEYAKRELEQINTEIEVRQQQSVLLTGHHLNLDAPDLHPKVRSLLQRKQRVVRLIEECSGLVAYRPEQAQFWSLLREVHHFMSSQLSSARVASLFRQMLVGATYPIPAKTEQLIREAAAWQTTCATFSSRLAENYKHYRDLITPFLCGVAQVQYGLSLLSHALHRSQTTSSLPVVDSSSTSVTPESVVVRLASFPMLSSSVASSLSLAGQMMEDGFVTAVQRLVTGEKGADDKEERRAAARHVESLLKASLLLTRNHVHLSGHLSAGTGTSAAAMLHLLLHLHVSTWQRGEEERRQRQRERDSLYKYKAETHGETRNEEERDAAEIQKMFPDFDKEFEDITVGFTLEDKPKPKAPPPPDPHDIPEEDKLELQVTKQQMYLLSQVHRQLVVPFTATRWMQRHGSMENSVDWLEVSMEMYRVAASIIQNFEPGLEGAVDGSILGSQLLASAALQNVVDKGYPEFETKHKKDSAKPYDFYHDANVSEAVTCRPLLAELTKRVEELMMEWPEHPTLKQIVIVMQRILGWDVTSPLIKFVTGVEVLIHKVQEWESNAARHVSLSAHQEALSHLTVTWRKQELRCWNACLDTTVFAMTRDTQAKWWPHLYTLIMEYMDEEKRDEADVDGVEQEESSEAKEGPTAKSRADLLSALQQFLEGASVGEYETRLQLLLTFHCHAVHMETSQRQGEVVRVLWNLHEYYRQFVPFVQAHLTKLRTPIERDLKAYVKIARWNDINFYALKASVEKTHKTLHKHMKQFKEILSQPVRPLLTDTAPDWLNQNEAAKSHDLPELKVADYICKTPVQTIEQTTSDNILDRLPLLVVKARKHSRSILKALPYHKLSDALNSFTGEVIETVSELQALDVTATKEKEKQRSEAKHIHLRKRKALADLFKYLQDLGLSYRKGMSMDEEESVTEQMFESPLNVSAALCHQRPPLLSGDSETSPCDTMTTAAWSGCSEYHNRCVSRRALLHTALNTPAKELGTANIARCRGFTQHLHSILTEQWRRLVGTTEALGTIRGDLSDVNKLCTLKVCIDQDEAGIWMERIHNVFVSSCEFSQQMTLLLQCCPKCPPDGSTVISSPIPGSEVAPLSAATQQDEQWTEAMDIIRHLGPKLRSESLSLAENLGQVIGNCELDLMYKAVESLKHTLPQLESFGKGFLVPGSDKIAPIGQSLPVLIGQIQQLCDSFSQWQEGLQKRDPIESDESVDQSEEGTQGAQPIRDDDTNELSEKLEKLCTEVLLGVQNLVKIERGKEESNEGEKEKEEEEEEENFMDIQTGHITQHMHKELEKELMDLRLEKVVSSISDVKSHLLLSTMSTCPKLDLVLTQCCHLVTQYQLLVQAYLTHAVSAHRTTAKLQSMLLALFAALAQKGFCLPAEYSDEQEGDGATQFEDVEGGGLGEGQGAKDVSDQIETEDQLDDAQKKGEEKEEKQEQPDVKAEDNAIEMSDDMDAKMHDMEQQEGDENSDQEEPDENELDKQMGDLGEEDTDKLDEQVWGDEDNEDPAEEEEKEEKKEEDGPGSGDKTQSELVAKDENKDDGKGEKEEGKEEQQQEEEGEEGKTKDLEQLDEREYDENEIDPHYGDNKQEEEPEAMDLPDDLNLDENEEGEDKEKGEEKEENSADLDKLAEEMKEAMEEGKEEGGEDVEDEEESKEGEEKEDGAEEKDKDEKDAQEKEDEGGEGKDDGKDDKDREEEPMETEEEGVPDQQERGIKPQEEDKEEPAAEETAEGKEEEEDVVQAADQSGKTEHDTTDVQQVDQAKDAAGENNEDEREGSGQAETQQEEGHEGQDSHTVTTANQNARQKPQQQNQRKPGQSKEERSLGVEDEKVQKRLKTVDSKAGEEQGEEEEEERGTEADLYEHVKEGERHDKQTMDVATQEQEKKGVVAKEEEEEEDMEEGEDQGMDQLPEGEQDVEDQQDVEKLPSGKMKKPSEKKTGDEEKMETEGEGEEGTVDIDGEIIPTMSVQRGEESTIHTHMEHLNFTPGELDIEKLREELEAELGTLERNPSGDMTSQEQSEALNKWHKYEAVTGPLAQELCEQLRLVLQPSQATKLKGDYRTGKRLNMRKVIPYIASQFRKDKIWMRRTKPSKRNYQVLLAMDDSSSMADNHSRQLAFESLSVVSNALSLLEVGQLAVASFGETVEMLHTFDEQFSSQSGAKILHQFSFEQKKTKIAHLLKTATSTLTSSRQRQQGPALHGDTAQLLLIVSDGRGLFLEGTDAVKRAVRQAREARIFIAFVIIDNPENKDSILDIRVPVFKGAGQLPEIKSYMDHFPFPFYIILKDINSLPTILSDALRQWFELVTSGDQ